MNRCGAVEAGARRDGIERRCPGCAGRNRFRGPGCAGRDGFRGGWRARARGGGSRTRALLVFFPTTDTVTDEGHGIELHQGQTLPIDDRAGENGIQRAAKSLGLAVLASKEGPCSRSAVVTYRTLRDFVAMNSGTGCTTDVGAEGVVERDWVSFTEIGRISSPAIRVAPKTDFAFPRSGECDGWEDREQKRDEGYHDGCYLKKFQRMY